MPGSYRRRQSQRENRTMALHARESQARAHGIGQALRQRQANAGALNRGTVLAQTVEWLKHLRVQTLRYSNPGVRELNRDTAAVILRHANVHTPTGIIILDGVA